MHWNEKARQQFFSLVLWMHCCSSPAQLNSKARPHNNKHLHFTVVSLRNYLIVRVIVKRASSGKAKSGKERITAKMFHCSNFSTKRSCRHLSEGPKSARAGAFATKRGSCNIWNFVRLMVSKNDNIFGEINGEDTNLVRLNAEARLEQIRWIKSELRGVLFEL